MMSPGEVLKVDGEGFAVDHKHQKTNKNRGDLFIYFDIIFP